VRIYGVTSAKVREGGGRPGNVPELRITWTTGSKGMFWSSGRFWKCGEEEKRSTTQRMTRGPMFVLVVTSDHIGGGVWAT
jgi:hypothetical protein